LSDTETADLPEMNEASADKPHRCRTTFSPDKYVFLTDGEMHDHRQWGTLLEDPDGPVDTAGTAPGVAPTEADEDPSAVTNKTTTGADAVAKQANAAPAVPAASTTSAPATEKKAAS
jgi:hypothetical protein